MYCIIRLFTHLRNFVPEIVPLWLKSRNQRGHKGGLMRWGLIRGVTQVSRKEWGYLRGGYGMNPQRRLELFPKSKISNKSKILTAKYFLRSDKRKLTKIDSSALSQSGKVSVSYWDQYPFKVCP